MDRSQRLPERGGSLIEPRASSDVSASSSSCRSAGPEARWGNTRASTLQSASAPIRVVVADSKLEGTVSGNSFEMKNCDSTVDASNKIDGEDRWPDRTLDPHWGRRARPVVFLPHAFA